MITCYDDTMAERRYNHYNDCVVRRFTCGRRRCVNSPYVRTNCGQYLLQKRLSSALHIIITME